MILIDGRNVTRGAISRFHSSWTGRGLNSWVRVSKTKRNALTQRYVSDRVEVVVIVRCSHSRGSVKRGSTVATIIDAIT